MGKRIAERPRAHAPRFVENYCALASTTASGEHRRTAVRMPRRISIGAGGQPGTATSTGMTLATPPQARVARRRRCRRRSRSRRRRRRAWAPASPRRCASARAPCASTPGPSPAAGRRGAGWRRSGCRAPRGCSTDCRARWISSSQPLHEPASTWRMASARPSVREHLALDLLGLDAHRVVARRRGLAADAGAARSGAGSSAWLRLASPRRLTGRVPNS